MGEADSMEVKQRLAKSLNVVIERAGPRVRSRIIPTQYRDTLFSLLPDYTTRANDFFKHPSAM